MKKLLGMPYPFWIALTVIIYTFFLSAFFSGDIKQWMQQSIDSYPVLAPLIIIGLRMLALVVSPIESGPVALTSLLLLPWWQALIYNLIGILAGDFACFFISRRFQEPITARFVSLQKIHAWQAKLSNKLQFRWFVWIRLTTAVACEYVSYAAGLTKIPASVYILATIIGELIFNLIFFYVGQFSVLYSVYVYAASVVLFFITSAGWGTPLLIRKYFMMRKKRAE